jgi:hypothetical protein
MAIEKSLYQAPEGIDALADQEEEIEIEIVDPEEINIAIGDIGIRIGKEDKEDFGDNLAEYVSDQVLATIADDLISDYEDDVASRKDWMQTYVDGLELLGLKIEERSEPWEGACGIYHPLLSEALVKFQAETMMSIFPAQGPAKTKIIGKETQESPCNS